MIAPQSNWQASPARFAVRRGWLREFHGAVTAGMLLVAATCSRKAAGSPAGPEAARGPASADASAGFPAETRERDTRTARDAASAAWRDYAGSTSCQKCHPEAFDDWADSNHALAERAVDTRLDEAAFRHPRTLGAGADFAQVRRTNGAFLLTLPGSSGKLETFQPARVLGREPLRQFLVEFPRGHVQAAQAAWDTAKGEWFDVFGSDGRAPGEWGHWTGRGMNWNSSCATCHNTGFHKNYAAATDSYSSRMNEAGVGCEACHGPLRAHIEWQQRRDRAGQADPTLRPFTRAQHLEACAPCHARRGELSGEFQPGDAFHDHFQLTLVDASEQYYADGQVREEDYEYASFHSSRMHWRGVTCDDCHNPHTGKTRLPGNWLCLRCHNGTYTNAPVIDPAAHSHHRVFGTDTNGVQIEFDLLKYRSAEVKETGGECVNCHLPATRFMQRQWRHDHGMTSPDPLLTRELGIPNACNRCHADQDTEWSITWADKWYGARLDRPARRRTRAIAAARRSEPAASAALLDLLAKDENPYWQAVATGLLGPWAKDEPAREALLQGLTNSNALVRAASLRAVEPLLENPTAPWTEAVRARLGDSARSVRLAAAWVLRAELDLHSRTGQELTRLLEFNADQPAGQMQLGALALARSDFETARKHYATAVQWDPRSAGLRHDYAIVLSMMSRDREALAQLETASRLDPRNGEFRFKLALALSQAGEHEQAIEALRVAVQLAPDHTRAWYNLGLALAAAGPAQSESALAALERAAALAPSNADIPYASATILARLGRVEEARVRLRQALAAQPDHAAAGELFEALDRGTKPRN